MKLQGLIATAQSLFGGHRPTFGFVVLPFLGVVLFPSPTICGSCAVPKSWKFLELGREHDRRGQHDECFKSRFLCYTSPPLFSLFPASLFFLLWFLP